MSELAHTCRAPRPSPITTDHLMVVFQRALDAEAQLPDPESAGFAPDAIREFLEFVQAHGGFDVPADRRMGRERVQYGSLMAGMVLGAVAAREAGQ
jgi:hypothetical protein